MSAFDRDKFWEKIYSMYADARQNNYIVKLNEEAVEELKTLFIDIYIPEEKLAHYDDAALMRKMMTAIVSICKNDKNAMSSGAEIVQLVNSVNYDGKNLYLRFARISPVRLRRFEIGKSRKEVAEQMGYTVSAVRNCEDAYCDLTRQPDTLLQKLSMALGCEVDELTQW